MTAPVELAAGPLRATVDPDRGATVTAFRHGEVDLFTPVNRDASPGGIRSGGCFPLVPWSNRIRDGELIVGEAVVRLPVTEPDRGHAIHGHGLWRAWACDTADDARVRLSLDHPAGQEGWPWAYRAEQVVRLTEDRLSVDLSVVNVGPGAMPVGLGLHPYFPVRPGTGVRIVAATAWPPAEAEKFPVGGVAVPAELDRRTTGPVPTGLDQGFGGWDGHARIDWPDVGLVLTMAAREPLGHLIVFTPADSTFFCLEPVSHAIDAANLAARGVSGTGHRTIEPGEMLAVTVDFTVAVS